MTNRKTYVVANPRNIPKGIRIMEFQGKEWYEGDDFVRPKGMSDAGFDRLLKQGYVTEK